MNIPIVPKTHTNTKIQRNRRSITMATYFQSSLTCKTKRTADEIRSDGWIEGWGRVDIDS